MITHSCLDKLKIQNSTSVMCCHLGKWAV